MAEKEAKLNSKRVTLEAPNRPEESDAPLAPTILIVEDEPIVAAHQRMILTEAGYDILGVAPDAEAALLIAHGAAPDIAVFDVGLRDHFDGITVGRELKRLYATALVFVTGQLDRAVRERNELDAVFLGKPFQESEILAAIAEAGRRPRPIVPGGPERVVRL